MNLKLRCKCCKTHVHGLLSRMDPALGMVCQDCYHDLSIAEDALFHAGLYYPHVHAGMYYPHVAKPTKPPEP